MSLIATKRHAGGGMNTKPVARTPVGPQTVGGGRCSGLPEGTADQERLVARAVAAVGLQDDLAIPTGGAHGTRQQMQEPT
jgi:hypothetical protein